MTFREAVKHSDPQLCRQCRGRCCQAHPGVWVDPDRFLACFGVPRPATAEELRVRLEPLGLTLREIDGTPVPAPRVTDQGCSFLADDGCRLIAAQRPCQCLALIPVLDTLLDDEIHCIQPPAGSTVTALRRWRAFWSGA